MPNQSQHSQPRFEFGDRVRHQRRPEWGIGSVIKTELISTNGQPAQRLVIRFENAGLKTLSTAHAELEQVAAGAEEAPGPVPAGTPRASNGQVERTDGHPLDIWRASTEPNWLEPLARRKIEEQMTTLPAEARDAFNSLRRRLAFTLELFRFDRTGGKLLDWAVAQSGLKDPLSRFTRHDLERMFDRWAIERDNHLGRLLQEARAEPSTLQQALVGAKPSARDAVKRINARM